MARLEIRLFGEMEVRLDGQLLRFPTQKTKELFAYLVTHRQCAHPRAALASLLWPESDEERAKANLRKALSRLRQAFGAREADVWLDSSGGAVRFKTEDCWIDLAEFERALTPAAPPLSRPTGEGPRALAAAIALYRGPFLRGIYEDWALMEGERLQTLYLEALEQLADMYADSRAYEQASAVWKKTLQTIPWHERAHRELMTLAALAGDRAAALQQYHEYVQVLQNELNATPLPEMRGFYEKLLKGTSLEPVFEETTALPTEMPFVGREREREILKTLWQSVLGGQGQAVLIGGEVGVGKTTFVQSFLRAIGASPLQGIAYASDSALPYQSLLQAVRAGVRSVATERLAQLPAPWRSELAQFVPELQERFPELVAPNPPLPPAQGKARWFAALTGFFELLARERPLVLLLEDLHWADEATLEYLGHLVGAKQLALPLLVIGTYRSEEALAGSRLRAWLDQLGPGRAYQPLTLSRLSREETEQLLKRLLVGAVHELPLLYEKTGGNPLFLVKLVRALVQSGLLQQDDQRNWKLTTAEISAAHLPESLRELIHASLRRVPQRERPLLGLAAVMGRACEPALLHEILRQPEEKLLDRLEGLQRAGLLVERDGRYQFYHELIRQVVYDELSADRRRLWHRQIGQALAELYPERLDELSGELAEHFERAQLWEKAIEYAMRAGARAQQTYAYGAARAFYAKALKLFATLETHRPLSLGLKRMKLDLCGRYTDRSVFPTVPDIMPALDEVQTATEAMIALASELGEAARLCEAYQRQARVELARGRDEAARNAMLQALQISQKNPDALVTVGVLENMSSLHARFGEYSQALAYGARAVAVCTTLRNPRRQGDTLLHLYVIQQRLGQFAQARETLEQALEKFQAAAYVWGEAAVLNNLGFVLHLLGQFARAQHYYERAYALVQELGDTRFLAAILLSLGALQTDQGRYDEALRYGERVRDLLADTGLKGLEIEAFLEQGRAHLGRGELALALECSTRAIRLLAEQHGVVHGFTSPAERIYFTHSQILQANQRTDEARAYLQKAYAELCRVAGAIQEEALRESFLQNVPINRQIRAAWEAAQRAV